MSEAPLGEILLSTDGSEDAALAARAAVDLCGRLGAGLHVVHVWHDIPSPHARGFIRRELERQGREVLEAEVRRVEELGGKVAGAHLREGRSVETVLKLAEELRADLIVVGSRGLGTLKRLALGSVSEGIAHRAACPVLVLRDGEAWPPQRVVAGDDGSHEARSAVELAARFAETFGAELILVRSHPALSLPARSDRDLTERREEELLRDAGTALEERSAELSKGGRELRIRVRPFVGDAATSIIRTAEEGPGCALIAVGARGPGTIDRGRLGSVSTKVLRAARCPVLVVPGG
jgi:nucleotide-binding universal stress UspA family protein